MKKTHLKMLLLFLPLVAIITSCNRDDGWVSPPSDVKGYKPIYSTKAEAFTVSVTDPQTLEKPGKIYKYQGLLFIIEKQKGVHIINNQNPSSPQFIKFIEIPGCNDVAVQGGILYADNLTDLVAFNISDLENITLVKRISGQFPEGNMLYPEEASNEYFECVDDSRGIVVGWEYTTLNEPKCYR